MSTELEKTAQNSLVQFLGKYKKSIDAVLPTHLTPDRVARLIVGEINRNPKLAECTPMSFISAVLTASTLGLEIRPGQAYLIPYYTKGKMICTLVIDYRGKIDLALRSDKVVDITPDVVWSIDKFRLYRDENGRMRMEHEPILWIEEDDGKGGTKRRPIKTEERGVVLGAYAVAELRGGAPKIMFMPKCEIDAIRDKSKGPKDPDSPWVAHYNEQAKKTVVHRICKTLPQSPELAKVQNYEDRIEGTNGVDLDTVIEVEPVDDRPLIPASAQSSEDVAQARIAELEAQKAARVNGKAEAPTTPANGTAATETVSHADVPKEQRHPMLDVLPDDPMEKNYAAGYRVYAPSPDKASLSLYEVNAEQTAWTRVEEPTAKKRTTAFGNLGGKK